MEVMSTSDWIMVIAIFLGPIVAVQLTRYLDNQKEIKERKINIFKVLMSTRAYTISWEHVMTLNKIDLEFDKNNRKEKKVVEAWKAYFDLLSDKSLTPEAWNIKRVDLLVELLHKMAQVLDYDFDKTHIKNSSYSPIAHEDNENEQNALRKGLLEILNGNQAFPMKITNWPPQSSD